MVLDTVIKEESFDCASLFEKQAGGGGESQLGHVLWLYTRILMGVGGK